MRFCRENEALTGCWDTGRARCREHSTPMVAKVTALSACLSRFHN